VALVGAPRVYPFDHDERQHPDLYLLTAEIEKTLSQIAVA
jgi:hypothetical protein